MMIAMKSDSLFKRIVVYILLICFILPTHVLYGAMNTPGTGKDELTKFADQYDKYIKEYTSLDLTNTKDTGKYLVKISSFIKKTVGSGVVYDISKDLSNKYWSEEINDRWIALLVLQNKLAEYLDLIKTFADQEALVADISKSQVAYFRTYLETLFQNADEIISSNPNLTVTELKNGEKAVAYPGVDISTNSAVTQNKILIPTGVGFDVSFIKGKDNWGTLAGILENYESEKYPTIVGMQLGLDLDEFVKANGYTKMKGYKTAIFAGTRLFLREKPSAVTRVANLMALQQLYESLYFEALGNSLRIYMDNIYMHNSAVDFSILNETGIKQIAEKACPLIDERETSKTNYKTAEYARYRCIKKMTVVAKDQIKTIANNPDIYKKQTLKELAAEINTSLIPAIIAARKDLATKIGASPATVTSGSINYSEDCPQTEGATKEYFAALNIVVNKYKGARFLYANEDLRDEYFGKPVSTFMPGRGSGMVEVDPKCQTTFSSMDETVTEEEVTEAFNDSQKVIANYVIELNKAYQNIIDDFLRQKFSTSYDTKYYKLLSDAGLWEITGEATGLEPDGDWYGEALKEESRSLDAIVVILKTTPSTAQKVYKENPKLYDVNTIVNSYLKELRLSEERAAEFRQYVAVVGYVAGTLLILTFFGSEAGIALIGVSEGSVAATTLATTATAVTTIGTPVFVASMGYEAVNNLEDKSDLETEENKTVTSTSNGEDMDLTYLDYLNKEEAEALKDAIVNGFFAIVGTVGWLAQMRLNLSLPTNQEVIAWYAKMAKKIKLDAGFKFLSKSLSMESTNQSITKFDLLLRYIDEAGLSEDDIALFTAKKIYVDPDLDFLNKPYTKTRLKKDFLPWFNKSKKVLQIQAGQTILNMAKGTILDPKIAKFLSIPKNEYIVGELCIALDEMGLDKAIPYIENLKDIRKLPGYQPPKAPSLFTKLYYKLIGSSSIDMAPIITDEEITPNITSRFPTFSKCSNWTNRLALVAKSEAELDDFLTMSTTTENGQTVYKLVPNMCYSRGAGSMECSTDMSVLDKKISVLNALGDGPGDFYSKHSKLITIIWMDNKEEYLVDMVTRNCSKQKLELLIANEEEIGTFDDLEDLDLDADVLARVKENWVLRIKPTLTGTQDCLQAYRTIFDLPKGTDSYTREIHAYMRLIWPPDGVPPIGINSGQ